MAGEDSGTSESRGKGRGAQVGRSTAEREFDPVRGNPFFGAGPIGEGGNSTIGLTDAVNKVQNVCHRCGPFADHDGATDRSLRIRRRGDQPRDDGFAHLRLSGCVEIPNAIEGGIKVRVREQLLAGTEKFLIRDHALAGGDGEPPRWVDGNGDGHGKETLADSFRADELIP